MYGTYRIDKFGPHYLRLQKNYASRLFVLLLQSLHPEKNDQSVGSEYFQFTRYPKTFSLFHRDRASPKFFEFCPVTFPESFRFEELHVNFQVFLKSRPDN